MGPVRILIADDHAIIRRGLRTLLEHEPGLEVIAEASDGREAIFLARRERPHVVILDIAMPNLNGIEAGRQIAEMLPETHIVILTVQSDEAYLLSALKAGARGICAEKLRRERSGRCRARRHAGESVFQP
jgi:DNA-binding NarL/FixJ family response regulator